MSKDYLTGGMADLAIFAADELSHSILEYIPLRDDELVLALPSGHPLAASFRKMGWTSPFCPGRLFILSQEGSFFRTLELKVLTEARVLPNVLCEISDFSPPPSTWWLAEKQPPFSPRSPSPRKMTAVPTSPSTPPAAFHIVIAYHKTTVLTGALRDLVMLLLKHLRGAVSLSLRPAPSPGIFLLSKYAKRSTASRMSPKIVPGRQIQIPLQQLCLLPFVSP